MVHRSDTVCHVAGRIRDDIVLAIIVVRVVVVGVACYFTSDRIVAAPIIRMAPVPVIAGVSVLYRPVSAQADKDVLAVIIRVAVLKREVPPQAVEYGKPVPGPDYSVTQAAIVIQEHVRSLIDTADITGTFVELRMPGA